MPEAGEFVTEGMRNLKTVSRDTGSWLDSIRSLGSRLAEPSDKEKEEQAQDRFGSTSTTCRNAQSWWR